MSKSVWILGATERHVWICHWAEVLHRGESCWSFLLKCVWICPFGLTGSSHPWQLQQGMRSNQNQIKSKQSCAIPAKQFLWGVEFGWHWRGSLHWQQVAHGPSSLCFCREKASTPWNIPDTTPAQPALRRKSSTSTWKQRGDFQPKRARPRTEGIPLNSLSQASPSPGWLGKVGFGLGILSSNLSSGVLSAAPRDCSCVNVTEMVKHSWWCAWELS